MERFWGFLMSVTAKLLKHCLMLYQAALTNLAKNQNLLDNVLMVLYNVNAIKWSSVESQRNKTTSDFHSVFGSSS